MNPWILPTTNLTPPPPSLGPRTLKQMLADYEKSLILEALLNSRGNQRRAARTLGLLPTTLLEKMKRLGVPTARRLASHRGLGIVTRNPSTAS
jgi:DNA-binding NtrC family response regulator